MPRSASGAEFRVALEECPASPALREQLARFETFDDWIDTSASIHEGDLSVSGTFRVPAFCNIVVGNLTAEIVDLLSEWDHGGLLIVIGHLSCDHYIGHDGAQTFIDGDLEASQSVLSGYSDSSLNVIGALRTKLFVGADIWAEVGNGAFIDYGVGYCLPIGYVAAADEAIRPRYGDAETARIVVPAPRSRGYSFGVDQFDELVRSGKRIFR